MDAATKKQYLADSPPTIVPLKIKPHFEALGPAKQRYAHHISRAAFSGTRIVLRSVSPESEGIYDFIMAVHRACGGDYASLSTNLSVPPADLRHYLDYAAQFLGNAGNYKSFGDSKFVPRCPPTTFTLLATASAPAATHLASIGGPAGPALYETAAPAAMHLGYPALGRVSGYYSADVAAEEIAAVGAGMEARGLLPENTRLVRGREGGFELLVASAAAEPEEADVGEMEWGVEVGGVERGVRVVFGDHGVEMGRVAEELREAGRWAANGEQRSMMAAYVRAFGEGSMNAHVESQRHWIRDKGPEVECNIGFIETYRDPHGVRGEWEGFAAMVNKERTRAFGALVAAAPELIPKLPWGRDFEKDRFLSPDFTSLEVLTFAGSGLPAGINIPNYDSIRQTEGFKNVSLGNVMSAKAPDEEVPFIAKEDAEVYKRYGDVAFEVQVGLHELLGHGCGKLLQETAPGVFNFDVENPPVSPVTGEKITTWYKPGETWGSVFGGMGPSYEECRAESVAMSLGCDFGVLKIFGYGDGQEDMDSEAGNVLHATYLSMARAGVAALQFWDPASRKWGQAHMQARHAILKVFLSAGPEFCRLEYESSADSGAISELVVRMDKRRIVSHGRPAVDAFLQKLNVFKATADLERGRELYEGITEVDDFFADKVRPEVLRRAQPRKVFVQANTFLEGDSVKLVEYEATPEGMIESYAARDYV